MFAADMIMTRTGSNPPAVLAAIMVIATTSGHVRVRSVTKVTDRGRAAIKVPGGCS